MEGPSGASGYLIYGESETTLINWDL